MSLEEAKHWLAERWVLHPDYQPLPHHSNYALVNVAHTFMRVRHRLKQQQRSFSGEVEQVRQKLRLIHGRVAA
jgi:hypothetical protein